MCHEVKIEMHTIFMACSIAVMATAVVAILTRKSIRCVRAALNGESIAAQTANCALLNMCLLLTWIVVLQDCVDVAKGASLSGLFSLAVFYFALAALLFNKLRHSQEAEPI